MDLLPPGFRFHPTDEELITHYLSKKVADHAFSSVAIAEVDMNKIEPWELPWKTRIGEKEWFFFSVRDRKYPTGMRTNRATAAGYWKATGKDKEIFKGSCRVAVGLKKTLVFYLGRAPRGEKTNWVSHEYRLNHHSSHHQRNEWVISRVFQKSSGGKKVHISTLISATATATAGPSMSSNSLTVPETVRHVHCFSELPPPMEFLPTPVHLTSDTWQNDIVGSSSDFDCIWR
ncbi:hypothetical protein M569_04761 [Genlisea aurea]|uniref:NAC domain-containing protein n=1 Tax=Genlisea aurea TaxID=192259 RepID=S8EBR6_9LAMI|nr:hypothetical protein M569_04761 [Genlisea aurea]